MQLVPRQSMQAVEHWRPYFWHMYFLAAQSFLHPHLMTLRSDAGAGVLSVFIGRYFPSMTCQLSFLMSGCLPFLSILISDSAHPDCGTLLLLKLVAKSLLLIIRQTRLMIPLRNTSVESPPYRHTSVFYPAVIMVSFRSDAWLTYHMTSSQKS